MKTRRVCAALGLGLAFAIASGCSSGSDKKDGGTGGRDFGFGRDVPIGRDTTSGQPCEYRGQIYQPGETFTDNCVRYRCEGGNFIVQIGGSPCSDGGPDTRAGSDLPVGPEVGRTDATGAADAGRDLAPVETGRPDARPPVDVGAVDVEPREDTTPREDTAPPKTDTAVPEADTAPPAPDVAPEEVAPTVQCTYGGQKYGVGVTFSCDCNTCKCDSTGTVVLVTNNDCTIDAG
jgi:hypothetical protein